MLKHISRSGCPSDNFRNQGLTQAPTVPTSTTNMSKNIEDTQEAALNLCQATPPGRFPPRRTGILTQRPP